MPRHLQFKLLRCLRCDYTWLPRVKNPCVCPNCHSAFWYRPRKKKLIDLSCKFCCSDDVVEYGIEDGIQYWWCKTCQRKFADNGTLPNM
jgi:uncharacterized protein YbaR (Trm112 family)